MKSPQHEQTLPLDRSHRRFATFLTLFGVTASLLCLLEVASMGALRLLTRSVFERTRARRLLEAYPGQNWAPALVKEEIASLERYDYEPYTIWHRHPFQGQALNIDPNGMRRTYYSHCDSSQYTIWMFGGSTMRGNGSPDWGTIPSQLAQLFENAGEPVCVRNFGEGAWVSTQEMIQLALALKSEPRKPDFVIFYDGANDTFVPYQSGQANVHMNFATIKNQFESQRAIRQGNFAYLLRTNTAQLVFTLAARFSQHIADRPVPAGDLDALARQEIDNYLRNIAIVQGFARQYGFDYAFFWQPVLYASHKPLTDQERQVLQSTALAHLATWCLRVYRMMETEHPAHFYNLADAFDQTPEPVFIDWCHVVMRGNRAVAQSMVNVVRKSSGTPIEVEKR